MSYLKPYKLYAFIALFALTLSTAGELLTPTIIQRTVDNVLVREWYGVDLSIVNSLPRANDSTEVAIGARIYVRASRLAGITEKERKQLIAQGLLDEESSYVFPLEPQRDKKLLIVQDYPQVALADAWGAIPSTLLNSLPSDEAATIRAGDNVLLGHYALSLLLILGGVLLATFTMTWFTNQIGTLIMKDMRLQLYRHVIEQSLAYLSRQPVGRLVTRLTSDIEVISQFFTDVLSAIYKRRDDHGRGARRAVRAQLETRACRIRDGASHPGCLGDCPGQGEGRLPQPAVLDEQGQFISVRAHLGHRYREVLCPREEGSGEFRKREPAALKGQYCRDVCVCDI